MQNWTTEEGLPQNSVHALLQSRDGYLWLATENGAARFNGLRFTRYVSSNQAAFASNDVCCLAEDRDGAVLFGTAAGTVREKDGNFSRIGDIAGAVVAMQRERDGAVLVLTADELLRVRGSATERLSLPGGARATAIGASADGAVLVAAGRTVFRDQDGRWADAGTVAAAPIALAQDAEHRLWLATAGGVTVTGTQGTRRWSTGSELPGSRVESLQLWPGGVLAGTNRGAVVLSASAGVPRTLAGPGENAILSALVDREGDVWFGTDSGGLFTARQRAVGTVPGLAGESVTALAAATDGTLWVGTRDAGLQKLHGGAMVALSASGRLASQVVLTLAPDGADGVWVGSPEGLDHVRGTGVEHRTAAEGLPDDFVRSLLAMPDGALWVGTRRGVAEIRGGAVIRVLTAAEGLPGDVIGAMLRDRDGAIWIGTMRGLARIRNGSVDRILPGGAAVTSLFQTSDGTVWVGTGQGLFIVRQGKLQPVPLPWLRNGVAGMVGDDRGALWLRTPDGIARASVSALSACAGQPSCDAPLRLYGAVDGMPSVELASLGLPNAAAALDGALWFTTRRGVAVLRPEAMSTAGPAPGITIERVIVDDRPVPLQPEVPVDAGKRRVAIEFTGLSLHAPGLLTYRYRMEGFDGDWSPWGGARVAEYTNLPARRLRFRVQAKNAEGAVSTHDATLQLRVRAPFFLQWWFYVALALLVAAVAYALYWLRLRRVRRDYEAVLQERNRIAREIHDTLAQDFVAVSLQLEVTSQLLGAGAHAAAREQIDATRTLVRDGIQDARDSIWAIRAGGAEETLPARLGSVVALTEHAALLVTGAYRAFSPSREREVYRIAKEAIGNAARHGSPGSITVDLVYSEDAIVLRVSDDGAGFDVTAAAQKAGHYGVRGMRERAAAMNASLTVQSAAGQGTCVELRIRTGSDPER